MYTQIFLVTSVRAIDFPPQIAANAGLRVFGAKSPTPFFFIAFKAFVVAFVSVAFFVVVTVVVVIAIEWIQVHLYPLDRYDDDDGYDHEEGDADEGDHEGLEGDEEGSRQDRLEGCWQEERGGHEEEGRRAFRPEDSEPCVGGDLRWEVDGSHGGDEEDLGLHQEERFEQRAHYQARLDAQGDLPRGVD